MLDVSVNTFLIPGVKPKIFSIFQILIPPIFSTGNPFQKTSPLSLSSILKKPAVFSYYLMYFLIKHHISHLHYFLLLEEQEYFQ